MACERPPRSLRSRLPLTRGRLRLQHGELYSPPPEGRAAEGGRGSLTHHLLSPLRGWLRLNMAKSEHGKGVSLPKSAIRARQNSHRESRHTTVRQDLEGNAGTVLRVASEQHCPAGFWQDSSK